MMGRYIYTSYKKREIDFIRTTSSGFTLIEVMIVITIATIIMVFASKALLPQMKMYTTEGAKTAAQQKCRLLVDYLAYDISMAGLDPLDAGIFGISAATTDSITFTADANMSGIVDAADENLTVEFSGTTIKVKDNHLGTDVPLLDNVTGNFSYFGANAGGTELPLPLSSVDDIRSVGVTVTVSEAAGLDGQVQRTLFKRINCRNL